MNTVESRNSNLIRDWGIIINSNYVFNELYTFNTILKNTPKGTTILVIETQSNIILL